MRVASGHRLLPGSCGKGVKRWGDKPPMANRTPGPFGVLLRRYRTAALLTQEELAARAHLSSDTIRALESGKRRAPRPDSARLLADALGLPDAEREALLVAAHPGEGANAAPNADDGLARRPAPLAVQPNLLLGRDAELRTIRQRLTESHARLLTLTGPAGVGKTRLALAVAPQVADDFPDGVALVDLAPIRDPELVLPTIARVVGLAETGGQPLIARLSDALRDRALLLVLDNFEQVLPAAAALSDLLATCPHLTLLVTSRVPLRLRWEWTLRIAPLPTPDMNVALPSLDALIEMPAIALFMERARTRRADFALTATRAPLVARLVSELDGLPLALELAAARLDALTLPMIAHRLSGRMRLLRWAAPDAPERQQSLEAAVGWSYELLSASEQLLFRCLGVFSGGVAPDAIAAVVAAVEGGAPDEASALEGLASLAEKSLVLLAEQRSQDGAPDDVADDEGGDDDTPESAFTMLETVREYAWERLEQRGELEIAQRAHARYFLALAERADPHLRSRSQLAWYARLEREHNNMRAALRWLLGYESSDVVAAHETGLRLAIALGWFWWTRGYIEEGARWLMEALARAPESDPVVRARALRKAGAMLVYQGAFDRASVLLREALTLATQAEDAAEVALAHAYLGLCAVYAGDVKKALPLLREGLRRGEAVGDPHMQAMTLMFLGAAMLAEGDEQQAADSYARSLARFEIAGDALFAANLQLNLGWFAWRQGEWRRTASYIRAGIEAAIVSGNRRLLSFDAQMALALLSDMEDVDTSADLTMRARLLGAIDALNQATGMTLMQTVVKENMATLREKIQRAGLEVAYREGRTLSFQAIVALALKQVKAIEQALV